MFRAEQVTGGIRRIDQVDCSGRDDKRGLGNRLGGRLRRGPVVLAAAARSPVGAWGGTRGRRRCCGASSASLSGFLLCFLHPFLPDTVAEPLRQ